MNLRERRNLAFLSAGASGVALACAALASEEGAPICEVILPITLALAFALSCIYFMTRGGGGRA